jgi:predicted negative regulator of RcsB-dependent stress response
LKDQHPYDRQHLKQVLHRNEVTDYLQQARDWAKGHLEAVLIGFLVLAALIFGTQFFLQGRSKAALEASKALAEAQRVFQQAQSAPVAEAPAAFAQAYAKYQAVVSGYEGTAEAQAARLGQANSLLAQGKAADAEKEFAALDSHDAKDTIAALAALGRARALEAQGKPEALKAYEDLLASYPDSAAVAEATAAAARLKSPAKKP